MRRRPSLFVVFLALSLGSIAQADTVEVNHGGDTFITGSVVNQTVEAPGETFISARNAVAHGHSQGDLHVTGYDVSVNADAAKDLYALGVTVAVRGRVSEDLTVAGFSVRTEGTSETRGNARLFGHTLTIDGSVMGALMVTGRDVILNAPIQGDARIIASSLSFGPNAVVGGTLTYVTEKKVNVPEGVAPAERVKHEKASLPDAWDGFDEIRHEMPVLPKFMSVFSAFVVSLLFFVVLGALMLGFMPKRLELMRQGIARAPGTSILLGVIGLSMLFGMVPITAMTIIGIPFVPIVMLAIVVVWTLGYALGAYSIAMRVWAAFDGATEPSNIIRLLVFAGAIICIAALNFIPFVGWVVNFSLVLLGIGAMTNALFQYMLGNPGLALDVDMKPIEE